MNFCTSSPVIISAPILIYFCINKKKLIDWLCLISLFFTLLTICVSGRTYRHYGMILCPLVVFAVSRLFAEIEENLFLSSAANQRQKLSVVLSFLCAIALIFYNPAMNTLRSIRNISPNTNSSEVHRIAEIIKEHTNEDDKISVCGNYNAVYLYSDRESISQYSYQRPISEIAPQIKEGYLEDIRKLEAKMVVFEGGEFSLWKDVLDIIEPHYEKIATIGTAELYLKIS